MTAVARDRQLSYADYLAAEARSVVRSQFFDGEIFAMAGGTPNHALLAANLVAAVHGALRGRPCRAYAESLRIYMPATGDAAYPDLSVICGPVQHDAADGDAAINPTLLVEVLSDSTEAFDRGDKFRRYRTLESLQAFLLVDQHERRLELFERQGDGTWRFQEVDAGDGLDIESLGVRLLVDEVYEGVELVPRRRDDGAQEEG